MLPLLLLVRWSLGLVRLHFSTAGIAGIATLHEYIDLLSASAHVLRQRRLAGTPDCPASGNRIHLRDAIFAIDGERAGVSRRDIATLNYGHEIVANEWSDPHGRLKAVIKRDVQCRRRLIARGWRDLIARQSRCEGALSPRLTRFTAAAGRRSVVRRRDRGY
jgi:hypothetical protein